MHLLQASEKQEKVIKEQKFEKENKHREILAQENIDESNVGSHGRHIRHLLASTQSHKHSGGFQYEPQRTLALQSYVLHKPSVRDVISHLQSFSLRVVERKFPQGIQTNPSMPLREYFYASRAKESQDIS